MKYVSLFLFVCCLAGHACAEGPLSSVSLDLGRSRDDIDILRIGLQKDFGHWLEERTISVSGYFELSLNYWGGLEDEVYGIALSPVFRLNLFKGRRIQPYLEGGIGAALISNTTIEARNLSSSFQFEDRIGLSIHAGNLSFHLKYMHYSNGSIKKPNNGIDLYLLGVTLEL